jgi:hypothetical protein
MGTNDQDTLTECYQQEDHSAEHPFNLPPDQWPSEILGQDFIAVDPEFKGLRVKCVRHDQGLVANVRCKILSSKQVEDIGQEYDTLESHFRKHYTYAPKEG